MLALELGRLERREDVFLKDAVANLNYQSAVIAIKASNHLRLSASSEPSHAPPRLPAFCSSSSRLACCRNR